ncbi:TetR/AcrR family transcriptional regulator [Pseudomaricurvus hydrocarbonicus]|nr:TetR/AcrR family transcriptional regulator [Aestuariicella hydrocarbonica]
MAVKKTLRDVQKEDTHNRLLDAAGRIFDREGYEAATVDQIAAEAGASRPTFYAHFRDKDQVLEELMAVYTARGREFMAKFPGPTPTKEEVVAWLLDVGNFLRQESAFLSLLSQIVGHRSKSSPNYGRNVGYAWLSALAERSRAFAIAMDDNCQDPYPRARAELLVIEIVWACASAVTNPDDKVGLVRVEVVADALCGFMRDYLPA